MVSNSCGIPIEDEELSGWREKISEALVGRRDPSWKEWVVEWVVPHLYVDKGKEKPSEEEWWRILKGIDDKFSLQLQGVLNETEEGILDEGGMTERMSEIDKARKAKLAEWGIIEDEEEEKEEPSAMTKERPKLMRWKEKKKGKDVAGTSGIGREDGGKAKKRKWEDLVDVAPGWQPAEGVSVSNKVFKFCHIFDLVVVFVLRWEEHLCSFYQ